MKSTAGPKLLRPRYLSDNVQLQASATARGYQLVFCNTGEADPINTVQHIQDRILKYPASQPAGGPPAVRTISVTYENLEQMSAPSRRRATR